MPRSISIALWRKAARSSCCGKTHYVEATWLADRRPLQSDLAIYVQKNNVEFILNWLKFNGVMGRTLSKKIKMKSNFSLVELRGLFDVGKEKDFSASA